ncbi:MAG: hypothetical protein OXG13_01880 [Gemmatimonadaceae bacterium]|nr:hypothetical protein [Gemmatimonadaceae bacterium]
MEAILEAGKPLAVAVTGGGSLGVSWLLNHPGASRALVEAQVPYLAEAIADYLGRPGPHRVREETARLLAAKARGRARILARSDGAVGAGATAALATDRVRKGRDQAFVCTRGPLAYSFASLRFDPGAADRLSQEEVLSAVLVARCAAASGVDADGAGGPVLPSWVRVEDSEAAVDEALEGLLGGRLEAVEMEASGGSGRPAVRGEGRILVAGSFNPLHAGHSGLAEAAERLSGRRACFELSVENVDKSPLAYREILERAGQARGRRLLLTREPTFLGKARLFPGCWFAIGFDTAVRLFEPAYYGGNRDHMDRALRELRDLGARFLVSGRAWEGEYRGLGDVRVPAEFADLLEEIPESAFRLDVSSTRLREEGKT